MYHSWHEELRNQCAPILIHTTHKMQILNQNNEEIPKSAFMGLETINPHYLCHQCSKHGPDCLFIKLIIKDFNDEPHFLERINYSQVESKLIRCLRLIM